MRSGIYGIWNSLTNKIYIGQAIHLIKRWKNHKIDLRINNHRNPYLQNAYNKDSSVYLVFYVLEFCEASKLDEREQYYMDIYNSYDREYGYNLSPTSGGSCTGFKHDENTKLEWSKQRTGKTRSPEARAAIKAGWLKRKAKGPVSEETKRKQSESHKNKFPSEATRALMGLSKIGNTFNTGRKQSPEEIEVRAAKRRGQKRSVEQLANIAAGKAKAARLREKAQLWAW